MEYEDIVKHILENKEFQKRKKYKHHGKITVYDHSLKVSRISYNIAKFLHFNYKDTAIGGLLHDFYYKPWTEKGPKVPFFKQHGFVHASEALENSRKHFPNDMNKRVENIIKRHMFPLNIHPPRYKEAWLVSIVDKIVSLEVIFHPSFFLDLIGVKKEK